MLFFSLHSNFIIWMLFVWFLLSETETRSTTKPDVQLWKAEFLQADSLIYNFCYLQTLKAAPQQIQKGIQIQYWIWI